MAVKVFLFLFLLGAVAACKKKYPIDGLVEQVKANCKSAGRTSGTCQTFADKFKEDSKEAEGCKIATSSNVEKTYRATINYLGISSSKDKTLLWSGPGMGAKAKRSSKTTIDKTSAGKSLDKLHWSKKEKSTDSLEWIDDTKACKEYRTTACYYPLEYLYWCLASKKFAAQASGQVEVYLTTKTRGGAYSASSLFRKYEVPNLNPKTVSRLNIKLYDSGGKSGRKCRGINDIDDLCAELRRNGIRSCKCLYAGTSKLAVTGNYSIQTETYWRPDGTCPIPPASPGCMKLPSVITIIIPILTLLVKS